MADSFRGLPAWKFCRVCRPLVEDMGPNVAGIALCAGCRGKVDLAAEVLRSAQKKEPAEPEPELPIEWTIDQETWRLESIEDGDYRLTKKAIGDLSPTTGTLDLNDVDLDQLMKVLAARGALER